MYYDYYSVMQQYQFNLLPKKFSSDWITGLATIFMSYGCHPVFFYLRGELRHKSVKRVNKVRK